ncbi:MAG: cyclase family protein [Cryomorphaceae bacterium]
MSTTGNVFDLSLAFELGRQRAWYVPGMQAEFVQLGDWQGSVVSGSGVNFRTLSLNPHAQGSHTETLGHVCNGDFPVHAVPMPWLQDALLISVTPEDQHAMGKVIRWQMVKNAVEHIGGWQACTALIIRTLPNSEQKKTQNYAHQDAAYFESAVGSLLAAQGIQHWLVDLPSVDREEDGGALACHRTFWGLGPDETTPGPAARVEATISELLYIPQAVEDGRWQLNLQVAPLENDAAPCVPILTRTT